MYKNHLPFLLLLLVSLLVAGTSQPLTAAGIDIPYEKFVLDNGLTLIVHEDHKAPIVAVNIWYHVGSKNEKPGKTGFAHLFEHLMFNGSENFDDDYFQAMERIGATELNGNTWLDRTVYFQNVPSSAVDIALWMESDRMGHLLGAVTQEKLDEQRGVVQNEKREYENQPYAVSEELITTGIFPKGHPYSWTTIGSMEDLTAASLEDVQAWFKAYYGAANAVLVIAGDITPEVALEKTKKYFGDIPAGPPVARFETWIAKRTETVRQTAQDRVPQSRLYRVWNVAEWGTAEGDYLNLASDVLASGKNSRFYKRLVYEDQIATDVSASLYLFEIAGILQVEATAKPGIDLALVEKTLDEELQKFLREGPTEKELQRVKTQYKAGFIRGIENIGGSGGKSYVLATNMVYGGSPDYYKTTLAHIDNATGKDVQNAAVKWLSNGDYILEITPFPEYATVETDVDRTKMPEAGTPPEAKFPQLQRAELSNGLKLVLAERHAVPLVDFRLLVDAGYAADQFASPGAGRFTMEMLDEGTKTRNSLQINEELAQLGTNLSTGSALDVSTVYLNTLKADLDASLNIFADVVLNPSFPQADFDRLQKEKIAGIQREKVTPLEIALRVFPGVLFGKDHPYGQTYRGSGTEASIGAMKRGDLVALHQTWFKPNNATLIITGDVTMNEVKPMLEKLFKDWKPGDVPKKNVVPVADGAKPQVYVVDRPGSQQSMIFLGNVAPPRANKEEEAIQMVNSLLGGDFTSRINMNLREDKHWTYGAGSFIRDAKGQRPYIVYSSVQSDKTAESMLEIKKELEMIVSDKPATADEFSKTQSNEVLRLPGSWETIADVAGSVVNIVQYNLPDDYYNLYPGKINNMTLPQVQIAAKAFVKPNSLVWIIVGDRTLIEAPIKAAGFTDVQFLDADGDQI